MVEDEALDVSSHEFVRVRQFALFCRVAMISEVDSVDLRGDSLS
jgi:hypothetical protein